MAEWLNTTFNALDSAVFSFMNSINCKPLTALCNAISFFGVKAWFFLTIGVILLLFRKTRKIGVCVLLSVFIGTLITKYTLKDAVGRLRPYTREEFRGFWEMAGANVESMYCFPSGHTTSATAALISIFIYCDKKWSWLTIVGSLLTAFARVYLIVHYTTDVIGGLIVGTLSAVLCFYLTKLIFKLINKFSDKKLFSFILNFDIRDLFKKKEN